LFFATSNDAPEIPHDDSLIKRVIACKMSSIPEGRRLSEWEIRALLKSELPVIIGACFAKSGFLEPGSRILCNGEDLTQAIDSFEQKYVDWLERHVANDSSSIVTLRQLNQLLKMDHIYQNQEVARYKRVLMSRYNVTSKQITVTYKKEKVRVWIYSGIRLREEHKEYVDDIEIDTDGSYVISDPALSASRQEHLTKKVAYLK
jgi:hypothetical protein